MAMTADPIAVHSAHAEVRPTRRCARSCRLGPLRARGGTPVQQLPADLLGVSTPRTRRYALQSLRDGADELVHSAHAEVRPQVVDARAGRRRPLRARGGTPSDSQSPSWIAPSTPRTRRYALGDAGSRLIARVHSAHAEVRPLGLGARADAVRPLRARGGTPSPACSAIAGLRSTPRTRRYAPLSRGSIPRRSVHSAHAEVRLPRRPRG